ncbi:TPA: fimbria/pilus outer membrane usher protein, partial [Salmonella enterica subsp. enterica serovar Muenchen]
RQINCFLTIFICGGLLFLISNPSFSREYQFDPLLIDGEESKLKADVDILNQGGQLPGDYYVKIMVNGDLVTQKLVSFLSDGLRLKPCIRSNDLIKYGIDKKFFNKKDTNTSCVDFNAVEHVKVNYNYNNQTVDILVPDKMLLSTSTDIAPQELWDNGVPAFLMGYKTYIQRTQYNGPHLNTYTSRYLQLTPGLNFGPWRLRNSSSWYQYGKSKGKYQSLYTYLDKGIDSIHSRLIIGESYSSGAIFESIPFRGVKVETDDSMVSYEKRSFSPVVRGIARTQARVEIRQNGYLLDSIIVPAGRFELTNLPSTGSTGEIDVSVFESDGSVQTFSVPFTAPAVAVREGYLKYSVSSGKYKPSEGGIKASPFMSAEAIYGMPWNITAYGGFQGGERYQATSLGAGLMLGTYGAISLDSTVSHAQKSNLKNDGYGTRWRLRYSNYFDTGVSFLFSGEEYESRKFNTLSETFNTWYRNGDARYLNFYSNTSLRSQFSVNLSQTFDEWGGVTLSGSKRNYWMSENKSINYSLGYHNNIFHNSLLSLNWSRNKIYDTNGNGRNDYVASLWLSIPLEDSVFSSYQIINQSKRRSDQELGLYGDVLNHQLHWDVREKYHHETNDEKTSSSLRLTYKGTYGEVGGNYLYDKKIKQMGINMQGNLLVTKESGLVLSQQQGDTLALVTLPGVSGAKVGYWAGVKTDFRGYTTLGYLQPYNYNRIYVNPLSLSSDVSLYENETKVVPTKGAVVVAKLTARLGKKALVYISLPDGIPVPFGSVVTMQGENNGSGIVAEDGSVYLTGLSDDKISKISVKWGKTKDKQCTARISVPKNKPASGIYRIKTQCVR